MTPFIEDALHIKLLKHYESIHDGDLKTIGLQPKQCPTGYWTMGWGHVIIDPLTQRPLKGLAMKARAYELYPSLTMEQAEFYLHKDLAVYIDGVGKVVKKELKDYQKGALYSFSYNIGFTAFRKPCGVLRCINAGNIQGAGDAFMLWNKGDTNGDGVLEVLPGLVARRKSERHLFLTGELKIFN